jgi:hypothetical protein
MSTPAAVYIHPISRERVQTYEGFSWPCFFAGGFWYVAKGMWGLGIFGLLLALVSYGLSWLVFPFFANGHYRKSVIKNGYIREDQYDPDAFAVRTNRPLIDGSVAEEISKLADLKASGVLTPDEFERRKARLLAT